MKSQSVPVYRTLDGTVCLRAAGRRELKEAGSTRFALPAIDGVLARTDAGLGALLRQTSVEVAAARRTSAARREAVPAEATERAARVGYRLVLGELRRAGNVVDARTVAVDHVADWT